MQALKAEVKGLVTEIKEVRAQLTEARTQLTEVRTLVSNPQQQQGELREAIALQGTMKTVADSP